MPMGLPREVSPRSLAPSPRALRMSASPRLPTSSSVSSTNRTSSILRGGGRLYTSPPLDGYTEQEMVAEAQVRWRPPAYRWRRRGPDIYLPPFVHLTMCTRMFVSILGPALLLPPGYVPPNSAKPWVKA